MTSRRICGFDTTPTYVGEEPSVFTIKLHIGGDLVWHPTTGYKDGGVVYFDHFNCHEGSLLDLRRMVKQLRFCDRKVQFWVLIKGKGRKKSRKLELRPLINDADIVNLVGDVPPNKELNTFVEHLLDDQWDYDVEITRELGDDCLLYDEINQSSENEVEVEQKSENEREEDNLIDTKTSSKQVNPDAGLDCDEVQELDCELSEEVLRSLENSDASDGELNVLENVFQERDIKKEGFKSNPRSPFAVKTYCPEHTCGDQDENKTVNSGFLAKMYNDDIKLNTEWGRTQFQEHVKAKLKCHLFHIGLHHPIKALTKDSELLKSAKATHSKEVKNLKAKMAKLNASLTKEQESARKLTEELKSARKDALKEFRELKAFHEEAMTHGYLHAQTIVDK
nr:Zinc knuckle family protein [Ipomoea batatas]